MFTWIRKENRSNLETEKSVCDIWKCPRARRGSTIGINIGLFLSYWSYLLFYPQTGSR